MEISNNSLNQPVSFYNKSTGNNINPAMESGNSVYSPNVFAPEFVLREPSVKSSLPVRKKKKSKRLNTVDTDFLPDEPEIKDEKNTDDNFFLEKEDNRILKNIKKAVDYFFTSIPLVNYFFLRKKELKIKETIKTLNDISQNVDDLMNTAVPYGEEKDIYNNIAVSLTNAASVMGKANKEL